MENYTTFNNVGCVKKVFSKKGKTLAVQKAIIKISNLHGQGWELQSRYLVAFPTHPEPLMQMRVSLLFPPPHVTVQLPSRFQAPHAEKDIIICDSCNMLKKAFGQI